MISLNRIRNAFLKPEVYTFKGGIHPDDMKERTKGRKIIDVKAPKELVFPLQQHIGAAAVPCVSVGDRVLLGQKIAEMGGYVSANIHSSVSGTVTAIEKRLTPSGAKIDSIVIENDGLDEACNYMQPHNINEVSAKEIIDIVKEAGIVGMGGATFPTHVKLSPPADKKIDYVIVNGAECEPYLTSDHRAMLETPQEIIMGLKLIMKVFNLKTGYIAIESNKPDAIKVLSEYAQKESNLAIKVVVLKTKYPQGSEKHLIKAVTGRSVPPGKLPMDVGAIVNNIDSCAAIARAVVYGKPLTYRIVTVGGDCVEECANYRVPIGTPFSYLIEQCGGLVKPAAKAIMGGPMMGLALSSLDVPVIKGASGILCFSAEMSRFKSKAACLRCGKCVSGCPMNLMPNLMKEAVAADDIESLIKLHIADCIQCGSCSYVCPAEQNPLQYIRTGKTKLINSGVKA